MSRQLAVHEQNYTREQVDLIKDTVCRGATDDEFRVFMHACKHTQLDPLMKQIYSIPRWDGKLRREIRTVQVSIQGKRLIADRTGRYIPGPRPTFHCNEKGELLSAIAYVRRMDKNCEWQMVEAEAFFDECVQLTKEGRPQGLWASKKRIMLAKCAESMALDRAFPAEMSNLYTYEEMGSEVPAEAMPATLTNDQIQNIEQLLMLVPDVRSRIETAFEVADINHIAADKYSNICDRLEQIINQRKAEGQLEPMLEDVDEDHLEA